MLIVLDFKLEIIFIVDSRRVNICKSFGDWNGGRKELKVLILISTQSRNLTWLSKCSIFLCFKKTPNQQLCTWKHARRILSPRVERRSHRCRYSRPAGTFSLSGLSHCLHYTVWLLLIFIFLNAFWVKTRRMRWNHCWTISINSSLLSIRTHDVGLGIDVIQNFSLQIDRSFLFES